MVKDPAGESRRMAAESIADGDPTGWFERLYAAAGEGEAVVPWDRGTPNPLLTGWMEGNATDGAGRSALVVGCALGRDAEYLAGLGFDTVAFDISATAVAEARRRHPDSPVHYVTADLLDQPANWREAFDLVVESMNVQALPDTVRSAAIARVGEPVAPGGTLLVVALAPDDPDGGDEGPPWPLTRAEVEAFAAPGLQPVRIEDIRELDGQPVRRWRAEFRRPTPAGAAPATARP